MTAQYVEACAVGHTCNSRRLRIDAEHSTTLQGVT